MSLTVPGISTKPLASAVQGFTPKLLTVLREGYSFGNLRADALAGLTVAIVALPLSMAIAIAAGAKPEAGLFTAIAGGFAVSALGGSRFQIGGPAGAFIVVMASTIQTLGYGGFLLATLMAGLMLLAIGWLRLGAYIRYVPYPVTVGFTAGIALVIFSSQIAELFGLKLEHDPGALVPKLEALWAARATWNPAAVALSLGCVVLIMGLRRVRPRFPGLLAAVAAAALATHFLNLPVATIGSRFGDMPRGLPWPALPPASPGLVAAALPAAFTFALLGAIESLLSAVVADGMTGGRHRSNCELVAQGCANIASALFGGMCVTGAIARTATNVRAQAHGPVSGMLHSVFVLLFLVAAAPLARDIPLCALAAILATVCWNMADKAEFASILRHDRAEAAVLLVTFVLTVFEGLAEGIAAGVALGALIFMHRMAGLVQVDSILPQAGDGGEIPGDPHAGQIAVTRIAGPFFFGAANAVGGAFDRLGEGPRAFILDLAAVPLVDATAAQTLETFVSRARRKGAAVYLAGVAPDVRAGLAQCGLEHGGAVYTAGVAQARALAVAAIAASGAQPLATPAAPA